MSRLSNTVRCMLLAASTAFAHGCADDPRQGWSTASIYPTQYKTIAVNIIENETYFREVGFMLTDAVITTIERQTPYKVTSETNADTLLTGRITNVNLTSLSQNEATGLDEEVIIGVTIDFNWTDLETDRTILERTGFKGGGLFVPTSQSRETLELGEIGVVQQLADDLVDEMQAVW